MNVTSRREELTKLKKEQLIDVCLSHWDNWITLEMSITDKEAAHAHEIHSMNVADKKSKEEAEKIYNDSHCYK